MTPWPALASKTTRDQRRAERQQAKWARRFAEFEAGAVVKRIRREEEE